MSRESDRSFTRTCMETQAKGWLREATKSASISRNKFP